MKLTPSLAILSLGVALMTQTATAGPIPNAATDPRIDPQVRSMHELVKMNVRRAGNLFHAGFNLLGKGVVLWVASRHLNVDRRGQTEVQDLSDDIRRLERELHVRELLAQPRPQRAHVVGGWSVT